jgi:hypothetical protein
VKNLNRRICDFQGSEGLMRKDQVHALLDHAGADLKKIEEQYGQALNSNSIPPSLQIDIKNYMENLRSALDYSAHDVYEHRVAPHRSASGQSEISKIYFPYGKSENDFKSAAGSSLPDLKSLAPTVYAALEAVQPYKVGDNWLYDFCSILNEKKHDTLTPQVREEKRGLEINMGGAAIKMSPGASISGSGHIRTRVGGITLQDDTISGDSPARRIQGDVKQTVVRWVSFKFADTGIEVLPLLKKALAGIESLSKDVYKEL